MITCKCGGTLHRHQAHWKRDDWFRYKCYQCGKTVSLDSQGKVALVKPKYKNDQRFVSVYSGNE